VTAYFDTSVITKWYLPEPDSVDALRVRARFAPPAALTHLHRVELVTAWHLKVFRREIPMGIVEQAWGHVEARRLRPDFGNLPVYDPGRRVFPGRIHQPSAHGHPGCPLARHLCT
jgi:predicted nucleic acid-binding protein